MSLPSLSRSVSATITLCLLVVFGMQACGTSTAIQSETSLPASVPTLQQTTARTTIADGTVTTSSSPEKPFQRFPESASVILDADVHEIFSVTKQLVEQHTNTTLDRVKLQLASNRDIQNEVKHETRKLVSSQFHNPGYAENFLQRMVDDQASSYVALYTERGNRILVSRPLLDAYLQMTEKSGAPLGAAIAALLIHELVHAADDLRFNIHENRSANFKLSFTQSAAFEGHAQLITREICTLHDCLSGMRSLERFMFAPLQNPDPVAQSVQAISRNILEYSYIEGERFLTALKQRPNGAELIDRVLRHPPADPIQILTPETYPDHQRQSRNQRLLQAIRRPVHNWTSAPWTIIETSPIKGINVRNNPERRAAAIEGFTQLIVAMESAQIYDQSNFSLTPIDVTLLQADTVETASLFADSFRQHIAQTATHVLRTESLPSGDRSQSDGLIQLYLRPAASDGDNDSLALVATLGSSVLQLSGPATGQTGDWLDYARDVMGYAQP